MAAIGFDINDVPPGEDFEPVPGGNYKCVVSEAEDKDTSAGDGKYLKLTLVIVEGQYENRKLWVNLNIHNKSEVAQKIGRQQLQSLVYAVGLPGISDSDELLNNVPFFAKVIVKTDTQYGKKNEVKGFLTLDGKAPTAPDGTAKPAAPKTAVATSTTPPKSPWGKK